MQQEKVIVRQEGAILRITFNRVEKKNAIDYDMYKELNQAMHRATEDEQISIVIFDALGDGFTAGNDLKEFLLAKDILQESPAPQFLEALSNCPKILLAAVQGFAIGLGTTMLLHCDMVIAANNARFQLPFINLGLVPEAASSLLLPLRLGHLKAAELLLLGEAFDAHTAYNLGLVSRTVEPVELENTVLTIAKTLEKKSKFALLETKKLMKPYLPEIQAQMHKEFQSFSACLASAEFKAAAEKFFKNA